MIRNMAVSVYGHLAAAVTVALWALLKCTVQVSHVAQPHDFAKQASIDCAWHDTLLPYFVGALPYTRPYVWMNHPAWYMKGIHLFLGWMRVQRLVLGSSGNGGQAALAQLVPLLQWGASTFLNPDGPYGPAHAIKNGVLDLSERSGLPIVAIRVVCSRALHLPTWDRKLLPLPGSRITLIYSERMYVSATTREQIRKKIENHLNG
jgi:lysophospholipid acyltransferase (LPLAT)-like uncharacterized protein